jgi:GT2 family glycosyltransferase
MLDNQVKIPEISCIVVTYNSFVFIKECLRSLSQQQYNGLEVIVVDNGSKDQTQNFIKENYPGIVLVGNMENLGSAAARNQGIKIAKGEWILTLDCDVILESDFMFNLSRVIKELPSNVGVIQPKILNTDKKTIYSCGISLSFFKRFHDIGKGRNDSKLIVRSKYLFGACSAAALYKKEMLEEIKDSYGYFDERFFFLVEDVDLAYRVVLKGWKTIFLPSAVCYHHGNSSLSSGLFRQYLCWRNRLIMLRKAQLNPLYRLIINIAYDFPRLCILLLSNPYVLRDVKSKGDGSVLREAILQK